jgi:hypothetical protein
LNSKNLRIELYIAIPVRIYSLFDLKAVCQLGKMLLSSQNPIDICNADGFEGRKQQ